MNTHLKLFCLIVLMYFTFIRKPAAQTMSLIKASDPNIQISGRIDNSDPDNVIFSYPGVSIRAKFEGTAIDAVITDYGIGDSMHTNYFNVIIDGGVPVSIELSSSQTIYQLVRNLTDSVHTIELFKRTESNVGKDQFQGFQLEAGKNLLQPFPLPKRKIEFIGNSITCGYGIEAVYTAAQLATISGFHSVNENNYKAWGAVTARNLNAQYSCVAYSGRGMYMNNTGATSGTLPLIYDYVIPDEANVTWDHNKYIPDVVVINLGTNDFAAEASNIANVDSATFVSAYASFILKLRGYYPNAKIVCVVGVMMSDYYPVGTKAWTRIQNYVSSVVSYKNKNNDNQVYYYKLNPQLAPYGEDWHPTVQTQNSMATNITNFIKTITGWNCTQPALGNDFTTCGSKFPITLNSHTTGGNNIIYKWYKNDTLLQNATADTLQLTSPSDSSGIYKVERDSASCVATDSIIVSSAIDSTNPNCKQSGISSFYQSNELVRIYPNPANNFLYVDLNEIKDYNGIIKLQDYLGRTIMEKKFDEAESLLKLNVSGLNSGLYIYLIQTNSQLYMGKIVKE